jgi:hypothetical protein
MPRICHHKSDFILFYFIALIQYHQSCSRTPLESRKQCFFFHLEIETKFSPKKREKLMKLALKNKSIKFPILFVKK